MKTLVIGGTGQSGRCLVQMLQADGQEVVVVTSGRMPVPAEFDARRVRCVTLSYTEALQDGSFLALLQQERPDALVDIIQGDSPAIYDACRKAGIAQIVVCGSVWMFGCPKVVPTPAEPQTECPFPGYKSRYAAMRAVLAQATADGVAFTGIMPPHICGPGRIPLDGSGGRSLEVHRAHRRGEEVILPEPGTTLFGPCDAEDVAQGYFLAVKRPESAGEIFNVGSAYSLTIERFIQTYAAIYGTPIPLRYVSPEHYAREVSPDQGANFHFLQHMCPDISHTALRLGYAPRYTPEQTLERGVRWMFDQGLLP
ncbi:MAG TPA: NAD(P)-dependent oxidoreductase [Armatimonadota bacterium]|jgi:nucleoside-diphosphate-sugar epimerase